MMAKIEPGLTGNWTGWLWFQLSGAGPSVVCLKTAGG